ncbi:MAG TPA: phosphoribosylanthranilate isomerase, partial [Bacteroidota bacterium]|nr:phosphoribosylanthranilate isomerase [Bacteroidota bacterium]
EDALAAAEEGASAVGFIFVPASPRNIAPESAGAIIDRLPPFVCPVGVFVDETRDRITDVIGRTGIRCLQLHGDESPGETLGYPVPVIKSFRVGPGFDPSVIAQYPVPAYLLDALVEGMHGGTGRTFDWQKAQDASAYGRIILSGGITAGNAPLAARTVRPYALDVNSGVESSPGIKDRRRIRELFESLRD